MSMVQYGLWPNCSGKCDFCLIKDDSIFSKEKMLLSLNNINENIKILDWKNKFQHGVSFLGGEIYHITDVDIQIKFLEVIDTVIEKILNVSKSTSCRYSTVSNGIYDSSFLYKVIDKIKENSNILKVDMNFSYDLKYRYWNYEIREQVINNIINFSKRYEYIVGIQMILTQYFIDMVINDQIKLQYLIKNVFQNCGQLAFLYPHSIYRGNNYTSKIINDFYFSRRSLLKFLPILEKELPPTYRGFIESVKNSSVYKYTGLYNKTSNSKQKPILSDGKELLNPDCGHSLMYQCYTDCDKCLLCDLLALD